MSIRRRCGSRWRCGAGPALLALLVLLIDVAPLAQPPAPRAPRPLRAPHAPPLLDDDAQWPPHPSHPSSSAVGAFFQVFRNARASEFALRNFRAHYPRSTVVMVCDGGGAEADAAMSALAARHGALYSLAEHTPSGRRQSFVELPGSALQWLSRLLNASCAVLAHGGEPFLMLLEDDVWVRNATRAEHLRYDVNGVEPSVSVFNGATSAYLREQQPLLAGAALPLAGFGSSIFRSAFLCGMWRDWPRVEADVASFYGLVGDGDVAAPDVIISFLTYLRGGSTGDYPGRTETWHADYAARMEAAGDVEVVHDYKAHYR